MKKKCFLYAYDKANLGDDLFIREISNHYSKTKFYLWSEKKNKQVFKSTKNLKVLTQDCGILALLKQINGSIISRYKAFLERRCDAVVYIGGSIFIEYASWKNILSWWDFEAKNRSLYVIGANFGPYTSKTYKDSFNDIFSNMKDICFRDKYSYNLFNSISSVRYAPDILFNYHFGKYKPKKQIFISVIDLESRNTGKDINSYNEQSYLSLISNFVNKYASKGYDIVLSSFCEIEGDRIAIEKVKKIIDLPNKNRIQCVFYDGCNEIELVKSICESKIVIASRFHAMILGFAAGKQVLPLIYSDKMLNVLLDLKFEGVYFDIRCSDDFSIFDLDSIEWESQTIENIESIKRDSTKHFELLDELLL